MRACSSTDRSTNSGTSHKPGIGTMLEPTIVIIEADDGRATTVENGLRGVANVRTVRRDRLSTADAGFDIAAADVLILSCDILTRELLDELVDAVATRPRPVVVFSARDAADLTSDAISAGVCAYIVDGISETRVKPIIDMAIAYFRSVQRLRDELDKAKSDLAARKVIERAKGVLMERRRLTEADAYNTLRRSAMAEGKTILEIASAVIAVTRLLNV